MWGLVCKPWNKDPVIRQPGFNGKYPAGFSFLAPLGRTGVPGLCLLELRWRWRFGPPWSTGIGTTKLYLEPFSWPLFCLEFGPTNKFQDVTNGMSSVFHCGGPVTNMNLKGPLLHRFFPKNPWWGLKNSEELVAFQKKTHPPKAPQKTPICSFTLLVVCIHFLGYGKTSWSQVIFAGIHWGIFQHPFHGLENWRILWHQKNPPFALPSCHYSAWGVHHAVQDIQKPGQVQFVEFRIRWSSATWIIAKWWFVFFKGKFREVIFQYQFTFYLSCCHQFVTWIEEWLFLIRFVLPLFSFHCKLPMLHRLGGMPSRWKSRTWTNENHKVCST